MIEELQAIKEQLFDAPSEVKSAFNSIVSYFDNRINFNEINSNIRKSFTISPKSAQELVNRLESLAVGNSIGTDDFKNFKNSLDRLGGLDSVISKWMNEKIRSEMGELKLSEFLKNSQIKQVLSTLRNQK